LKIFLSGVSGEFRALRQALASDLHAAHADPVFQEDFQQHPRTLLERLESLVREADAVVAVLGAGYGAEPAPGARPPGSPRRSYAQWEWAFAQGERLDGSRARRKDILAYLAGEGYRRAHPVEQAEELAALQRAFLDQIKGSGEHYAAFDSGDDLRAKVLRDLLDLRARPHRPVHLPFPTLGTLFKGREGFLARLRESLVAAPGRAAAITARQAIHGLGGVGKTRAAVEYAWRHQEDYSALLFLSAPSAGELRARLADLVGVLGVEGAPPDVEGRLTRVLRWLDDHPGWLLILDNVDTPEAAAEAEALLARLRAGHVLITSRLSDWSGGVEPLGLDVLAEPDAVAFLLDRARHRVRSPDDPAHAAAIARDLDGLALALEQAAAYADRLRISFAEYRRRWEGRREAVLGWFDPRLMAYPRSVATTWQTTFDQLAEPERRLLDVLAWLAPEPIPPGFFEAGPLTARLEDPRAALAGLAEFSLVDFEEDGGVTIHRLVQEAARGLLAGEDRLAALRLALETLDAMAVGESWDVRYWPVWTPLAPHAEAVARHADAAGLAEPTARLMDRMGGYWKARGAYPAAEPLRRRALAIDERLYGPDHPRVATRLNNLASLLQDSGRPAEAEPLIRRALAIAERAYGPDHPRVAVRLNNLGQLLHATGRLAEAEPPMRRALAIDEGAYGPDHPRLAIRLNNLALLLQDTGHPAEAEPLMGRALAIAERAYGPDHPRVAVHLSNLAALLHASCRPAEAEPPMRRALAIEERAYGPNHPNLAGSLGNLACLLQDTGRTAEAEPLIRRSVEILRRSFESTGFEHPRWAAALEDYRGVLESLSLPPEEAERRLAEASGGG
jgi:tetratricopeptide (TPR) repeat protein